MKLWCFLKVHDRSSSYISLQRPLGVSEKPRSYTEQSTTVNLTDENGSEVASKIHSALNTIRWVEDKDTYIFKEIE